jgi:4-amino-4-deoxy-L-arabinose transferase-like glycosyltransferase
VSNFPAASRRFLLGAAACVALYFLFFHRLADRDLWSSHEARAAMDGQSVLDGDWKLPRLYDGRAEMQKPPLYYWLVALAAAPGGAVDAWAVRLPAALSAVGCVAVLAGLGLRRGRPFAGILAGVVLATAVHFTWLARIGRIDMPLSLTTTLAVACFHLAGAETRRASRPLLFGGYVAVAAGVMLKGPIGAILPLAVVVVHRWLERLLASRIPAGGRGYVSLRLWWGLPLVAALTLPWFLWANAHTGGEFAQEFFWRHNVERGLGNGDLRSHPWWLYLPYFAGDFLPWTPLLALAAFAAWRRGWWRDDAEMRLGAVWFVVIFGGLSLSSFKRGDYLLPAYPGAALFLGCALERWRNDWAVHRPALGRGLPLLCAIVAACVALGWVVRVHRTLPAQEAYRNYETFAAVIRGRAPAPQEVIFFRTEAHALAFHTGEPMRVLSEWGDLDAQVRSGAVRYVVMPPDDARDVRNAVRGVNWEDVASNVELAGGRHERPLVLLRAERIEINVAASR